MTTAVITGLGALGAWGAGEKSLARVLRDSRRCAVEVEATDAHHPFGARQAALVGDTDLSTWVPARTARRMSPPSKYAVAAARMALEDGAGAGMQDETAVCLAAAFGPNLNTESLLRQMADEGPEAASPFLFSECVANVPAAQVAIAVGARGPNIMVTQREAGPCLAVARGTELIESGRVSQAIVGAVDEMTPLTHAVLDRFRALARPRNGDPEAARPFDLRRNGCLAGEGAVVLLLEREDAARARGARVLARVRGYVRGSDPSAPAHDWGNGYEILSETLRRGLARQGLEPAMIDRVVSGASGSRRGDRVEALTLRRLFNGAVPPVLAPKAVTGEFGGGQIAAAVLAAAGRSFGPTPGFAQPDRELGVVPTDGRPLAPPRLLLVSGLAAGGAATWVVLEQA